MKLFLIWILLATTHLSLIIYLFLLINSDVKNFKFKIFQVALTTPQIFFSFLWTLNFWNPKFITSKRNTQFLMIKDESDPSNRAGLWLIRGSKAGTTEYTFFDDITYSTGKKRKNVNWFLIYLLSPGHSALMRTY